MTKPPTCWVRWRGSAQEFGSVLQDVVGYGVSGVEAGGPGFPLGQLVIRPTPDRTADRRLHILRQAECLCDLAACGAGAVTGDGGRQSGVFLSIALVDVLDDFLARRSCSKIDVDIGWLVAVRRHEAIESTLFLGLTSVTSRQ